MREVERVGMQRGEVGHRENVGGVDEGIAAEDGDEEYGIHADPLLFVQQLAARRMDQVV